MEALILDWQPVPAGARLIRAYADRPDVTIPETIEGLPLVEIGDK